MNTLHMMIQHALTLIRKLYLILGKVIEKIYESNIGSLSDAIELPRLLVDVLQVEQELSTFAESLPPPLRIVTAVELDAITNIRDAQAHRFRLILTVRLLNVRLLLHRRTLSYILSHSNGSGDGNTTIYPLSMASSSLELCIEAAVETIAIISRTTQPDRLLPIWWWSAYFGRCRISRITSSC
jgi:hypothetical protein